MAARDEIVAFLDAELNIGTIEDESLNGLQVQGGEEVTRIALVTDAAVATTRRAIDEGCQMIVAHHGILWKGMMSSLQPDNDRACPQEEQRLKECVCHQVEHGGDISTHAGGGHHKAQLADRGIGQHLLDI